MDEALRHVLQVQRYIRLGLDGQDLAWVAQQNWARIKGQILDTNG